MLYLLYPLNALLMLLSPIALGVVLARKARAPWNLFGIGAATFIGSQIVHLPLNAGLTEAFRWLWPLPTPKPWHIPFNAAVLGLTAGVCEEMARYVGYRFVARSARAYRDALMLGAGHGGIEAIILGLLTGYTFIRLVSVQYTGLDVLGLSGPDLDLARQQVSAYWSSPAYLAVLGAVERFFALSLHVSLSVLVLQVFVRRQWRWLWAAIGYHALADAATVLLVQLHWPALAVEYVIGLSSLGALGILWALRPRHALVPAEPDPILIAGASALPVSSAGAERRAREQIDNSKYA